MWAPAAPRPSTVLYRIEYGIAPRPVKASPIAGAGRRPAPRPTAGRRPAGASIRHNLRMPLGQRPRLLFARFGISRFSAEGTEGSRDTFDMAAPHAVARPSSSLDIAAAAPAGEPPVRRWPVWVRLLILFGGSAVLWAGIAWAAAFVLRLR